MFEGLHDRRIRLRLDAISERAPRFAPVEARKAAFAGYVQNLMRVLDQSALGRALLANACKNGVSVGLDVLLEPSSSFYYPAQNHIDLGYQPDLLQKTEKGLGRYFVSFTGALRRAWHHHEGVSPDLSLRPEDYLEHFRISEADTEAVIHQVAWELRAQGAGFLWRHLLSGPNGDITLVFERAALEQPANSYNGHALKCAFNQWFAESERTAAADHLALETIDMALVTPELAGLVGRREGRRENMQYAGLLPGGANYLAGCLFTGGWYRGPACDFNRAHLRHILLDIDKIQSNQASAH